MRPQRLELFASGPVKPEALWALVGDPRRLPEWTDAEEVAAVEPEPVALGSTVVTRDGERQLTWEVTTLEPRLIELVTRLEHGVLGIGASVVRESLGKRARLVLAAAYRPGSRAALLRFRLGGAALLRRRFDVWTRRALAVAAREGADGGGVSR